MFLSRRYAFRYFSSRLPSQVYQELVAKGRMKQDQGQLSLLPELDRVYKETYNYNGGAPLRTPSKSSWFSKLFTEENAKCTNTSQRKIPPRGLYLFGGPGSGKTLLMDLLYDCAHVEKKQRVHFNSFMINVHDRIHKRRQKMLEKGQFYDEYDPLPDLATSLHSEVHFLCFDEFQVTDIADAMILRRLFDYLFEQGVVVIATSNRPPKDLYKNGLQRELFLPFLDSLQQHCNIAALDTGTDYRKQGVFLEGTYFFPLHNSAPFEKAFEAVTQSEKIETKDIQVLQGRTLKVVKSCEKIAMFTFSELCKQALGSSDYAAIAQNYHTVFLRDIPLLDVERRNELRRFITLIDELYQAKTRLICLAECAPGDLFDGSSAQVYDEVFAFERCLSRLVEMQSKQYLDAITFKVQT